MVIKAEEIKSAHYISAMGRVVTENIHAIPSNVPGIFAATRAADGLAVYMVDARMDSLGCTCQAGQAGKVCKHLVAAALAFGTAKDIAARVHIG